MRWRRAVFAAVQGLARGLQRTAHGLMYLGAGVLGGADLGWAIAQRWRDFGGEESHVFSGLLPWEKDFYERFLKPDDDILVIGCGTGRDLIALVQAGHRVHGLEPAAPAIAVARRMLAKGGLDAPIIEGPVETAVIPRDFDVFLFSWYCYGYLPRRAARIGTLRALAARLRPGGRILISYPPCREALRTRPLALTTFVARLSRSDWRPESGDVVGLSLRGVHFEHRFRPDEIEMEAEAAGLTVTFHDARDEEGLVVLTAAPPPARRA